MARLSLEQRYKKLAEEARKAEEQAKKTALEIGMYVIEELGIFSLKDFKSSVKSVNNGIGEDYVKLEDYKKLEKGYNQLYEYYKQNEEAKKAQEEAPPF